MSAPALMYQSSAPRIHAETPEQALWTAVVIRAAQDVGLWWDAEPSNREAAREAVRWLFHPLHEGPLEEVCGYAHVDVGTLRRAAKDLWMEKLPEDYQPMRNALWAEVTAW